jgi:hypothetical protein
MQLSILDHTAAGQHIGVVPVEWSVLLPGHHHASPDYLPNLGGLFQEDAA